MMVDKFENIKAGVFIELLPKKTQKIEGVEPTIRVESDGQYLLSIPKSLKKDFADDYWVTLKYVNRYAMVKATIITLKERVDKSSPNPYLYKEYYIKLKKPLTKEEFKYFLKKDRIYEIDRERKNPTDVDGGYLDYDVEWLENAYCWTTYNEIFPMKIISSQRSMLNWDKEPWSDLK